jgi:hypothetical protein
MKYWINVISRDHVQRGVDGGFTQANHGKASGLKRMQAGDWIIFYSPKSSYQGGEPLQAFTAIGQIADEQLYQFEMTPDFVPWRRRVTFMSCHKVPVRPLIDDLDFILDKVHWGHRFRFGLFPISEHDFKFLHSAMIGS